MPASRGRRWRAGIFDARSPRASSKGYEYVEIAEQSLSRGFAELSRRLAEQIRGDEVDVLFDLTGHCGTRLGLFARRAAPVQVTWLGYVGTTGVPQMDYLLADRFHVPAGEEACYTESILRMPYGYSCYGAPPYAPRVAGLPATISDRINFGCFNNPAKYSPSIIEAWCKILQRVPTSKLLLKYGGLQHPGVQKNLRERFAHRGISGDRILFEGWSLHGEFLATYNRIDLALDTQPYSGGVTTCEALWMGVPVVTCPGETFAGRHSVSHLSNAGYPQFIAPDLDAYIDLAVSWANRLGELAAMRAEMREKVRASPLCDADGFARDFLEVMQEAWKSRGG